MLLLPALLLCSIPQASTPSVNIRRATEGIERPKLDGVLDEPFWDQAVVLTEFYQTLPVAGGEPSERTEILLIYDDTNFYVGLRCFDKNPSAIRATQMARDANLDPDDRVELLFDTFDDKRSAFWFQLGAAGSEGDALISNGGSSFNKRWDTIWDGISRVTDEGWFGEIRIPFASVNFDPHNKTWGFNARRFIRRNTEEVRWASPEPRLFFFQPVNSGKIHGMTGMRQGLGLDVVPFFVGTYLNGDQSAEHLLGDSGLDLFYRLTPNMKLSLSYNTDFAETEVDSRAVNLSRFPLFFPEKRKFFLEDSGTFNFGVGGRGGGPDPIPFFSRRIGLDPSGNEVPLLLNTKLTSSTDSYSFGLLNSQTKPSGHRPGRNLFVGRFTKNILEQSNVGVLFTRGDPNGTQQDYTAGADLTLQTTTFMGNRSLRWRSYVLGTGDSETAGKNMSYSSSIEYPNDQFSASFKYLAIEENFNPALGFVRQSGIERYDADITYAPRLNTYIRRLMFGVTPQLVIDSVERRTETERITIMPFGIEWESGEILRIRVFPRRIRLFDDFDIQDSVSIPEGSYEDLRYNVNFETADKRDVSTVASFTGGTFFGGNREDYSLNLDWRAHAQASFQIQLAHNNVRLPGGDFQVNIMRLNSAMHMSPRLSWSNNLQWDDVTNNLGLNSRLRVILEPGRDLFVVLNQGWSTVDDSIAPTETDLRFKISYTFRF